MRAVKVTIILIFIIVMAIRCLFFGLGRAIGGIANSFRRGFQIEQSYYNYGTVVENELWVDD